jgi:hypothetical protein
MPIETVSNETHASANQLKQHDDGTEQQCAPNLFRRNRSQVATQLESDDLKKRVTGEEKLSFGEKATGKREIRMLTDQIEHLPNRSVRVAQKTRERLLATCVTLISSGRRGRCRIQASIHPPQSTAQLRFNGRVRR